MASTKESDNASKTPSSPKNVYKDPDDGRQRFLLELEFVQGLANRTYIDELTHRQRFFFGKNCRNNQLKLILPEPPPEPVAAPALPPPATVPTQPPVPATIAMTTAPEPPASALSPMPCDLPSGSVLTKNDTKENWN